MRIERSFGAWRVWFYRMPWALNYRRPRYWRLKDGRRVECLSFVFMFMVGRVAAQEPK